MSHDQTTNPSIHPVILSMEVDDDDSHESEYRLQIGNQIRYLTISPGTFDRATLSFPLQSLPNLPYDEEWTVAHIWRDKSSGALQSSITNRTLAGISRPWHQTRINCLELQKTEQLTATAFEALSPPSIPPTTTPNSPAATTVIAKIARFEWELPRIEQETRAYQLLQGTGLAPRFLGHVHENGRIMGFLVEKLQGRPAALADLGICEAALAKFHELGFVHGDVNRYNFLVSEEGEEGVKLLDFEYFVEHASPESMRKEFENLRAELVNESGRGGGFDFVDDSD
ncbi:alpha-galactosidase A [Pseudovirgaria hyperparasitica]|uniref:Alpha-galactosidase A n=1 Tax=Pseudovirgaria hyperparasitica TaxID=470096 RepID=A0A6A6W7B9_9PEZI|nr:alpha-galactosidase A [Pseudovirgaria hyperparasitica]KAF2758788.1 alpha-galactosidase A [Pseudovirgaria hyperparasitica]